MGKQSRDKYIKDNQSNNNPYIQSQYSIIEKISPWIIILYQDKPSRSKKYSNILLKGNKLRYFNKGLSIKPNLKFSNGLFKYSKDHLKFSKDQPKSSKNQLKHSFLLSKPEHQYKFQNLSNNLEEKDLSHYSLSNLSLHKK